MSSPRTLPDEESRSRTAIPPALDILPVAYRVDDAALALGVSERKVWRLIADRKIPSRKIDGSTVILVRDLHRFVKSLPVVMTAS